MGIEEELINYFNENIGLEFKQIIKNVPYQHIKYSQLLKVYKKWRKEYINSRIKEKELDLDQYSLKVANNSRNKVDKEQIKQAILLRRKKVPVREISKITKLNIGKLDYVFTNARMFGFLEGMRKKK